MPQQESMAKGCRKLSSNALKPAHLYFRVVLNEALPSMQGFTSAQFMLKHSSQRGCIDSVVPVLCCLLMVFQYEINV